MKESRLYLNFFKENLQLIIIPSLIGAALGVWLFFTEPPTYNAVGTLKVNVSNLIDSSSVADQVVANLRAVEGKDIAAKGRNLSVYKSGPDTIELSANGGTQIAEDLDRVIKEAEDNFSVRRLGKISFDENNRYYIMFLLYPMIGFGGGILLALIRTYIKKF